MTNIGIKNLFRNNRLPEGDSSLLLFILYSPLGLCLVVLRSIILSLLFIFRCALPESLVLQKICNKIACVGLGVSVHLENSRVDDNVEAYVSNNISVLDNLVVSYATGSISPVNKNTFQRLAQNSSHNFGSISNVETFKKKLAKFLSEKKALFHFLPEGKPTNGKALLKFKTYPFEIITKIQPVCISIERPVIDIAISTLGSNYFSDIFYYMFCPFTNYKLRFLASLEKKTVSSEEFAEIARQNIASALQIELSDYTCNDLEEWEKKQLAERKQQEYARPVRSLNPDLQRMSLQVKEVLPHVPVNVIYNDLCITRSIDNTITNILEGRLNFIPEIPSASRSGMNLPSTSSSSSTSSSDLTSTTVFKTTGTSFSKSASERSRSFQERKEQLIASARKRYIEKHNLKITV